MKAVNRGEEELAKRDDVSGDWSRMILDTRFRLVILLCLGSEVSLSLWPSSGFGVWPKERSSDEEPVRPRKKLLVE
jgi:hypothetical protein